MGFRIFCDNKGCGKDNEPVLDKDTGSVLCTECGKEIKSITDFAKRQMVALGQIRRTEKKRQAWAVKCDSCKKEAQPKLENNKLICSACNKELTNIAKPFMEILKQNLRK
jgi:hypothetical protein